MPHFTNGLLHLSLGKIDLNHAAVFWHQIKKQTQIYWFHHINVKYVHESVIYNIITPPPTKNDKYPIINIMYKLIWVRRGQGRYFMSKYTQPLSTGVSSAIFQICYSGVEYSP